MANIQITFSSISLITYKSHNYVYVWRRIIIHMPDAQVAFSIISVNKYESHNYVYTWCEKDDTNQWIDAYMQMT